MSDLIITNETLWVATQPSSLTDNCRAWNILFELPMTVLGARNASALNRKIMTAVADIDAARLVLLAQCGTKSEGEDRFTITDVGGFDAGWTALMQESVTLSGVRAIHIHDLAPTVTLTPAVNSRLGALLVEE